VYRATYTPQKVAQNRDAQIVAHFLPHFGARPLDDITKSDIVRYLNFRRTQLTGNPGHKNRRLVSESTVRRERGLLRSIFERAIEEGHDIRNPFRDIKRGKDKPRTRVLTLEEESVLLEALHRPSSASSGSRWGLVAAWTKSAASIPARHRLAKRHRTRHRQVPQGTGRADAAGRARRSGRALDEEGRLWRQNPQRLREVLAQGTVRAKVPHLTPHVLRHKFGTRWLQAGGDIYKLSRILGHASVSVTEAHYAHLLKEDLVAASQQIKIPVAPRLGGNVVKLHPRRSAGQS
jgi:site-specific recombinase XerD